MKKMVDDNAGMHDGNAEGQLDVYKIIAPARGLTVRAAPDITAPIEEVLPVGTELAKLESQGDWLRHSKGWSLVWGYEQRHFVLYLEQQGAAPKAVEKPVKCACTKCKQPIQASVPIAADGSVTELIIVCPFCESRFRMKISQVLGPREGQRGEVTPGGGAAPAPKDEDDGQVEGQASIELHAVDGERSPGGTPSGTPRSTDSPNLTDSQGLGPEPAEGKRES